MKGVASISLNNQRGFTLIELILVIVILGILAVVAIPKYGDMQTEARVAAAKGVYGAAQGAVSINFATGLVGKAITARPAYDVTNCPGGIISNATCLVTALDGSPEGWLAAGNYFCSNGTPTAPTTCSGSSYWIAVTGAETATQKATLTKNF